MKEYSFLYHKVFLTEEIEANRISIERNRTLIGNRINQENDVKIRLPYDCRIQSFDCIRLTPSGNKSHTNLNQLLMHFPMNFLFLKGN